MTGAFLSGQKVRMTFECFDHLWYMLCDPQFMIVMLIQHIKIVDASIVAGRACFEGFRGSLNLWFGLIWTR